MGGAITVLVISAFTAWQFYNEVKSVGADRSSNEWDAEYNKWLENFKVWRPNMAPMDYDTITAKLQKTRKTALWGSFMLAFIAMVFWAACSYLILIVHAPNIFLVMIIPGFLLLTLSMINVYFVWNKRIRIFKEIAAKRFESTIH